MHDQGASTDRLHFFVHPLKSLRWRDMIIVDVRIFDFITLVEQLCSNRYSILTHKRDKGMPVTLESSCDRKAEN